MDYLNTIFPQFEQAFNLENISIKLEEDHFVVQSSSDQTTEEKVRRIIKSMNYCPLTFKCSTTGAIKFTITPYQVPACFAKKTKEGQALKWGAEVASGAAQPVSEFDSSIDPLLKKTLGEEFFEHNIAKVVICGYPFILIADRHQQPCFRLLLRHLIHEIHQRPNEKIALFVEACDRDPSNEAPFFSDHLKTINPNIRYNCKKLLYGVEECNTMQISGCIKDIFKIRNNTYNERDLQQLFYSLCKSPGVQKLWAELKQTQQASNIKTMMTTMDRAIHIFQTEGPYQGWQMIKMSQFYTDFNSWAALLTAFIHLIVEKPDFQGDIKIKVKNFLANSQEEDLFNEVLDTINLQRRDPLIVENMWSVIQKLPQNTEIVLFLGYLHMRPVIEGLQKKITQS